MRHTKPTWILVADSTKAKIFEFSKIGERPVELFEIHNLAGHMKERDLASDRPGRAMHDSSQRRNALNPRHEKTEQATQKFIGEVLTELSKLSRDERFSSLVVVAEPRLLGKLRDSLSTHEDLHVTKEVRRDLLSIPSGLLPVELQKYIDSE